MASPQQQTPTLLNVTLDDFDPPLVYADQSQWATPDPSAEPARFNQTTADGEFWQGTTHSTTVDGAQVAFNFSGPSPLALRALCSRRARASSSSGSPRRAPC